MKKFLLGIVTLIFIVCTFSMSAFAYADGDPGCAWIFQPDGNWKFEVNGVPVKNDWIEWNGKAYLFNADGIMMKGWQVKDGALHYFSESNTPDHPYGSMYVNETTPDGKRVNEFGIYADPAATAAAQAQADAAAQAAAVQNQADAAAQAQADAVASATAARPNPYGETTCVEVCLSEQTAYVYVGKNLLLSTPVVTGKMTDDRKTPVGNFSIYSKETNRYLQGKNSDGTKYKSYVKYWMPFHYGYGLHDASWRSQFGGNIYVNGGSHGCVNMPPAAAEALFNIAYVGMPVYVHN